MNDLPASSRVIIVGGGIVGCSTAYHLAKLGVEVLLLERNKLTSGSTWHAAGLVGQLRSSANITQLLGYSVQLYDALEQETAQATGWKRNGGLRLACNAERWTEVRRQATTAQSFGLEMHLLTPAEAQDLWPIMAVSDLIGAAFLPTDGQANPADITQALAKGARQSGTLIRENCPVLKIEAESGQVRAVHTPTGRVTCEKLVLCCGQWTRELARTVGVNVPLVSVQHQYIVTEPVAGVSASLPTLRDPDRLIYFKEEVGGLVMGGYEPNPKPWAEHGVPENFAFGLLDFDTDHFEPLMEQAIARVPALSHIGVKSFINGPESFTPDGNFILGEAPELRNLYIGAGFNAFGIASGGGAGMALAEWVANGEPPYDLWSVDIRRFGRNHQDTTWVRQRTLEAYAKHYTMAWPFEEHQSGRPSRRSPLYERLKTQNACFGEKLGWERPNWFADSGERAQDQYSYGRQNWFDAVGREHRACRERAVVFDQSSFAKFLLSGPDAESALSWICANNMSKPAGSLTYTQLLNRRGGIECDLTVAHLGKNRFYIVTGTGFATHDFDWIKRNIPDNTQAELIDMTSNRAVLSLMGPRSREILAKLTEADLSSTGFPFARAQDIHIAGAPVLALRITYVGELGWELHIPTEFALTVYDALFTAGREWGLVNAGYRAIESLRLEKGYCAWGADIGPDHTPLEAGLSWAVKLGSNTPFLGREALLEQRNKPLGKRLACFTVDDPDIVLLGRETIYRNGQRVGWLASAGWGYTVDKNIGYGYVRYSAGVDRDYLLSGDYELDVAGKRVACQVHLKPLYDPDSTKIKA